MSIKSVLKSNRITARIILCILIIRHDIKAKLNVYKTIRLNFKYFPFKTAIKFPILVYGKLELLNMGGSVIIQGDIKSRMIKIGYNSDQFVASNTCGLWDVKGLIVFKGKAIISVGPTINVDEGARLIFGNCISLGAKVKLRTWNSIIIDDYSRIALESQLFDTDFHLIRNIENGKVYNYCAEIYIGKTCWIGNRCTITKGTYLPERTIVASNSLLNKDYAQLLSKPSVIGGIPAKLLKENIVRIYDYKCEREAIAYFKDNPAENSMEGQFCNTDLQQDYNEIQKYYDSII
ncbi:MAG: hypothetical protein ACRCSR_04260 [Bacteroidales bacterium]